MLKFFEFAVAGIGTVFALQPMATNAEVLVNQNILNNISNKNILISQERKRPEGSTVGVGRDPNCLAITKDKPDLTAITPIDDDAVSTTFSQSPTFYFYSPYKHGKYLFRLYKLDKKDPSLYSQELTVTSNGGIFAISLPVLEAIQPESYYFWELRYLCSKDGDNLSVFGNLYRDRITDAQRRAFAEAKTPIERIDFYRQNKIWLELVDELVKTLPESRTIWQQTLNAEQLQSISNQPIIPIDSFSKP